MGNGIRDNTLMEDVYQSKNTRKTTKMASLPHSNERQNTSSSSLHRTKKGIQVIRLLNSFRNIPHIFGLDCCCLV